MERVIEIWSKEIEEYVERERDVLNRKEEMLM